jgi:uncharacterized membrane protein
MSATQTEWTPAAEPGNGLKLVLPSRGYPVGAGWTWIAEGWTLFKRAPLMWILSVLVVFVAAIVIGLIPFIGSIIFNVLNAAIGAGFVVACRSLERGGEFELEHLFAGFRTRFGSLLVVGLLLFAGSILICLVFAAFVGFSIMPAILSGNTQSVANAIMGSVMSILLGALVALALFVPLLAAYWFAPALVIMHGLGPVEAMKQSLVGCLRNFIAFLWYGIVMAVFAVLAAIPIGLGYLVWVPLAIASTYAAYRAIFTEDAAPATAVGVA